MNEATRTLRRIIRNIEQADKLDEPAERIQGYVDRLTKNPTYKAWLSGAPLGHRLHPMLTDVTIGCWTSATVLDLVAWHSGRKAASRLAGLGVLAALPTVATGLSDWSRTRGRARRVGLVHLATNSVALVLEYKSWSARRRGRHVQGALFGLAGIGAGSVGGYLGGHLAFTLRVGVDAQVSIVEDDDWHEVCQADDLVDNQPVGASVGDTRVVLVRKEGHVYALAAACTHEGGPLDRGEVRGDVIVCPWHGSEFCLRDGEVVRGPAATPEPVYETRRRGSAIEIRRVADPRDAVPATTLAEEPDWVRTANRT